MLSPLKGSSQLPLSFCSSFCSQLPARQLPFLPHLVLLPAFPSQFLPNRTLLLKLNKRNKKKTHCIINLTLLISKFYKEAPHSVLSLQMLVLFNENNATLQVLKNGLRVEMLKRKLDVFQHLSPQNQYTEICEDHLFKDKIPENKS